MTASVIGALRVTLGLDSAQFDKGAKGSARTLKAMRGQLIAVSAVAASVSAALGGLTIATAKTAAEITRLSQVSNTAPEVLQRWTAATKTVGIEQEKLSDILKDVNDRVGDFLTTGGGPMADFFEKIAPKVGITADAFRDLSGADALQLFVSSLEKANLSQAEMTFYMEAMASDSTLLLPLLRDNASEMTRLGESAATLGAVMSNETVAALNSANIAVGEVSLAFQGMRNRIAGELAPALESIAMGFANAMREGAVLREVTDTIIQNLDVLAAATGAVVAVMGVRYVAAMAIARGATVSFTGAVALARAALAALTGPLGLIYSAIGLAAGAFILFRDNADTAKAATDEGKVSVNLLNEALDAFSQGAAPDAQSAALTTAQAHKQQALAAIEAAKAQLELNRAMLQESLDGVSSGRRRTQRNLRGTIANQEAELESLTNSLQLAQDRANALGVTLETVAAPAAQKTDRAISGLSTSAGGVGGRGGAAQALGDTAGEAKKLAEEMSGPLPTAIDGVAQAFGDFVARGFKDFKGFADSVLSSFKSMIAQMIATAARNKIMLSIGAGGSVAGTAAQAGTGLLGGAGNLLGGGGGLLGGILGIGGGGGALGGLGAGLGGILSGGGIGASFANLGGLLSGSVSGLGAIGAALPALGLIAAPFAIAAAFKKQRTLVDAGLNVGVNDGGIDAQSFQTINTKRFFGLSSKTRTGFSAADPAIAQAIGDTQSAVQSLAANLGIGADAFRGFSYSFSLSLKDMDADQAAQAVTAEVSKLGDAFAAMIPHISSVNELMAVYSQRLELEDRLLELQGRGAELLARQRQRVVDATNALNRPLLQQIFALEDQQQAIEASNAAIQRTMDLFRAPLSLDSDRFDNRFSATIAAAEERRFQVQKAAEDAQLTELKLMRLALEELRKEARTANLYGVNG